MSPRIVLLLALGVLPAAAQPGVVFESEARLVEVYVTVLDRQGRFVDGLTRGRFQVTDNGQPRPIVAFETVAADLSCAILLDTTGSMARALPVVKNAILRMLDRMRPNDEVAVYGFSATLTLLQGFTTDKSAAKKAVLEVRAQGRTALFDALSQVSREISRRAGKKVIVAFTDGLDNASVLHSEAALTRARKVGALVYTVAQGEALQSSALAGQLKEIARRTGGQAYQARQARDVERVFQDISEDLRHTYLLAYKPPPASDGKWRTIQVAVGDLPGAKVRAKEGYFPE